MTRAEKDNWIINLENTAADAAANCGQESVDFVLSQHHAKSVYDLRPCDYSEVFSELYQKAVDN